ncbi:MAG: enoyl-CoA hydratase-related protein [Chloroflexota bacterium]|nr:enoyl-CoA hydratase-related protein [Chloroflexota bacterium]
MWSAWEKVAGFEGKETVYEKKYRDRGGGVARISSNRPQRMNAMTNIGWTELTNAVLDADGDKDIGVIVIASIGDHFGVGGDMQWEAEGGLEELFSNTDNMGGGVLAGGFDLAIIGARKPVIAAVKGYCIGGHNHLAYHCDLTIAADNAIFGQNGPRIASPIHGHLVSSLSHVVGIKKAKEIWMLCRHYTAQQALEMGLINAIVPLSRLDEEVDKWCDDLLNIVPTCLTLIKRSFASVDKYLEPDLGRILTEVAPDFFARPEVAEAHQAFFEKRTPEFWQDAKKASG